MSEQAPAVLTRPAGSQPPAAVTTLELGLQAAEAYGRSDLYARLEAARDRMIGSALTVLVVGEFKQGKSSLVNALIGLDVCPVDDDVATAVPTVVRHGTAVDARAERAEDGTWEPIDIDRLREWVSEAGNAGNHRQLRSVEATVPSPLLAKGLILVDTPGAGGLDSSHGAATAAALPLAEAVIFVTDASQELTAPELEFLRQAHESCPTVVVAQTKTDLYPAWRDIVEENERHLAEAAMDLPILPVSSLLRREAVRRADRDLNGESGFPVLVRHLETDVLARAGEIACLAAQSDLRSVTRQLAAQFEAELAPLEDPSATAHLTAALERAKARADDLKSRSARWQQTLGDSITDLTADTDHDLRQRTRMILQQVDEALDEHDPADIWNEFEPWLQHRVASELVENFRLLAHRAEIVSERVADHFASEEASAGVEALRVHLSEEVFRSVAAPDGESATKKEKRRDNALAAVRGSYSGVLMVTMIAGMVGMTAMAPLSLAIGVGLGRKSMKQEKERQLLTRRQYAKNSARKYVDDVSFIVQKDSRDALRRVQRTLRDHYTTRAEELQRSVTEAFIGAKRAVEVETSDRAARMGDLRAELGRIAQLQERVEAMAASPKALEEASR